VVDCASDGSVVGLEFLDPQNVNLGEINSLLERAKASPIQREALAPLAA
jgi:hypothetical protein